MTPQIAPLRPDQQSEWEPLARGYKAFYREDPSDEDYRRTWSRLMAAEVIFGLGAHLDGRLVGIAHYLFHPTVWLGEACYLQDLFTAPGVRGRGVARALIEAVAEAARARGASRYYWLTAEDNETARALYDKVATYKGFIRYEFPV
ncbi:GNAT family N-acetyltransferase [Sphingosinicella terrae]|uniref:GNAT family N-acetyltransferase n=1 Tax=Sphingosinicella terrae TaxID=2172047 RepID=UPI000E0DACBA|nr:GNAT family N-acetyltransferase [Sphingosinicella terrae]